MGEPTSASEYEQRYKANTRISGFGVDVVTHFPCPFCAAPDFMAAPILGLTAALAKGGSCAECGRSARAKVEETENQTTVSLFQTGGPPASPWIPVAMAKADTFPPDTEPAPVEQPVPKEPETQPAPAEDPPPSSR